MIASRHIRTRACALLVLLLWWSAASAVELDPKSVTFLKQEQFKWRDPTHKQPVNQTTLQGTPNGTGLYININAGKPNRFAQPHYHPNDRFIMVIKGPWWVGSGTTRDTSQALPMPPGTLVTHYGKQVHWDGAKDDETYIYIIGEAPATNIPVKVPETAAPYAGLDPKIVSYIRPDQYKWRDPFHKSPTNQVVLHGDPSKPGLYITLNRFSPGAFSRPHFHPNDRFIMVLKGTWWVGTGPKFDTNNTVPMPTGTFVTHFGRGIHYDGAKDEEVMVLITGMGPATLTRVNPD
jgi:oxalate decarboxylase/phosphoglucose isomerase-like protein (cupin superfamily)